MRIDITFAGNKKVDASFKGFTVHTDQPVKAGGDGTAPSPFELFLASLGSCTGYFIKAFCDQRNIPADNIKITQDLELDPVTHMVSKVNIGVQIPADFPEKYKDALLATANSCTVKKHLYQPPQVSVFYKSDGE